jgi:hypothetical protein
MHVDQEVLFLRVSPQGSRGYLSKELHLTRPALQLGDVGSDPSACMLSSMRSPGRGCAAREVRMRALQLNSRSVDMERPVQSRRAAS